MVQLAKASPLGIYFVHVALGSTNPPGAQTVQTGRPASAPGPIVLIPDQKPSWPELVGLDCQVGIFCSPQLPTDTFSSRTTSVFLKDVMLQCIDFIQHPACASKSTASMSAAKLATFWSSRTAHQGRCLQLYSIDPW